MQSNLKTKKIFFFFFFLIFICFITLFYFNFSSFFTFESLKNNFIHLKLFKEANSLIFTAVFISILSISSFINLPINFLLNICAGIFFGYFLGTIYTALSVSIGSLISYVVFKYFFFNFANNKVKKYVPRFQKFFKKNEVQFILILRMLPIIPLSLQNFLLISLGSDIKKFFILTFIGVLPVGFIVCFVGYNFDLIINKNFLTLSDFFRPIFILPILFLIFLIFISKFFLKKTI